MVTITAVPESGWEFSGWGGALLASGTTNPSTLEMTQDRWVQATFTEAQLTTVILLDDGFEGGDWDGNWDTNSWYGSTYNHDGSYSAAALNGKEGTFTSDPMDASDAASITVDFWFMKMATDSADYTLYFYDGSSYVLIDELDDNGGDYPTWLHYTYTTTNSRYFTSGFRIRLDATLGSGEQAWLDDVLITKESGGSPPPPPPPPDQYTLMTTVVGQGQVNANPSGPYDSGTGVTLTAVPASGWEFSGWSGALSGTTNPTNINMNADKWVQVTFTQEAPPPPYGPDLEILRFESSHTLGSDMANGDYICTITDMYFCWPWHSPVIDDMHAGNPESEVIVYYDFMNILSGTSLFNQATQNNWILKNQQGEYIYAQPFPDNKVVDRGSQGYRQYVADWLQDQVDDGFEGVFADNALQVYPPTAWTISERPVNPRTGQLYTDQEWFDDTKGFTEYIKNAVPEAKMVINGMLFNGRSFYNDQQLYTEYLSNTNIDIVFIEGMFNNFGTMYSESDWKKSVDLIIWFQNNFLTDPDKSLVIWSQAGSIPAGFSRDEMARFIFTSSLLGISRSSQNYVSPHGHMESATTQNLYQIELGMPTEAYHEIGSTSVYEREFTKVKVLVNPTSSTRTVSLGSQYRDMDGNIVSTVSLPRYSGTILTPTS
jgi:hypothetical protein